MNLMTVSRQDRGFENFLDGLRSAGCVEGQEWERRDCQRKSGLATLIQGENNWNVYCILFAVAEFSLLAAFLESKKRNYFSTNQYVSLSKRLGRVHCARNFSVKGLSSLNQELGHCSCDLVPSALNHLFKKRICLQCSGQK